MFKHFHGKQTARGGPLQLKKGVAGKTIGAKRTRKIIREAIQGITPPAIRRMARRGGVKRMSKEIYDATRQVLHAHLAEILQLCCIYVEHRNAKTVICQDVLHALQKLGRPLYGFDPAMKHLIVEKSHRHKKIPGRDTIKQRG